MRLLAFRARSEGGGRETSHQSTRHGFTAMKLGVMSSGIAALGWDKALAYCHELGLEAIELTCGVYAKNRLIDPDALLNDASSRQKLKDDLARHELIISALSCHGNPVHPDVEIAKKHERV